VKFVTPARGALFALLAVVLVHLLLKICEVNLSQGWLSPVLSIGLLLFSCGLYAAVHLLRHRIRGRQTLEIGRRGFMITQPDTVPFALAWRMIRTADLEGGTPAQWRFGLKNGNIVTLREATFTREQWKKICTQLEKKFRARKIPVRVMLGPGLDAERMG
jgi:hypothetical protein